jgi:hypothetical protein
VELFGTSWNLADQVCGFEEWLSSDAASRVFGDEPGDWMADLGFTQRGDACGGGPVLTVRLMRLCIERNVALALSEYPGSGADNVIPPQDLTLDQRDELLKRLKQHRDELRDSGAVGSNGPL